MINVRIEADYNKVAREELLTFCERLSKMALDGDTIKDIDIEYKHNERTGNKIGANIFINLIERK